MRLRTDDDIYRARLLYLGPPGYTFPVQLPYTQYGLFAALLALCLLARFLVTGGVSLFPAWEIAVAMFGSSAIFRYVDPDRPVRKIVWLVLSDWRRSPPTSAHRRSPRLSSRRVVLRPLILAPSAPRPTARSIGEPQ